MIVRRTAVAMGKAAHLLGARTEDDADGGQPGLPWERPGGVLLRRPWARRLSEHMKRILLSGLLATALTGAFAAEKLRRDEGPTADAHFFERNRDAKLERWTLPEYPAGVVDEARPVRVKVCLTVDEQGAVADPEIVSGDERFHAAALATVRQWHFRPAMENGKLVARSLQTTLVFRRTPPPVEATPTAPAAKATRAKAKASAPLANEPPFRFEESPVKPPGDGHSPDPVYPRHLVKRELAGQVELLLGIDEKGRVRGVEVVRATHADFLSAAFATVEQWQLAPARRGSLPVKGEKIAVLTFQVMDTETNHTSHEEWLEQNGIRLADSTAPVPRLYFDRIPEAVNFVDPVYPAELREKGTSGSARVDFTVDRTGSVVAASVGAASEEAFGAALLAAVAAWKFQPLYHGGEAATVDFQVTWQFAAPDERNTLPENLAALAADAPRANARELDRPLEPLYLCPPVRPPGATASGVAEVEVTINASGRVCWPRVVKADDPALGWAAATAVSQWYFATPRRKGEPVGVRVIIPVQFPAS